PGEAKKLPVGVDHRVADVAAELAEPRELRQGHARVDGDGIGGHQVARPHTLEGVLQVGGLSLGPASVVDEERHDHQEQLPAEYPVDATDDGDTGAERDGYRGGRE